MKYIFLALTCLCSLNVTEEKHDLERLFYLCYLKQQFIYRIDCESSRFQESERDLCHVGLIEKRILKKG